MFVGEYSARKAEYDDISSEVRAIRTIRDSYETLIHILKKRVEMSQLHCDCFKKAMFEASLPAEKIQNNISYYEILIEKKCRRENKLRECEEKLYWVKADLVSATTRQDEVCIGKYVYESFKKERIRKPVTVEEQFNASEMPVETKHVRLAFSQWKKDNQIVVATVESILMKMTEEFGEPENGKFWRNIKLFRSDEDVEEWDKEHPSE
jgi:hypothetical protein